MITLGLLVVGTVLAKKALSVSVRAALTATIFVPVMMFYALGPASMLAGDPLAAALDFATLGSMWIPNLPVNAMRMYNFRFPVARRDGMKQELPVVIFWMFLVSEMNPYLEDIMPREMIIDSQTSSASRLIFLVVLYGLQKIGLRVPRKTGASIASITAPLFMVISAYLSAPYVMGMWEYMPMVSSKYQLGKILDIAKVYLCYWSIVAARNSRTEQVEPT